VERQKNALRTLMLRFQRNRDNKPGSGTEFPFVHPQSFEEVAGILRFKGTTFIYKHSTRCSVSLFAMKRLLTVVPGGDEQWIYIDVVGQRPISLALAEELNIWHESPQLIMLQEGKVVAHCSHHQVNEDTVESWRKTHKIEN
jgi:bacillithiol system protein YtxJ